MIMEPYTSVMGLGELQDRMVIGVLLTNFFLQEKKSIIFGYQHSYLIERFTKLSIKKIILLIIMKIYINENLMYINLRDIFFL